MQLLHEIKNGRPGTTHCPPSSPAFSTDLLLVTLPLEEAGLADTKRDNVPCVAKTHGDTLSPFFFLPQLAAADLFLRLFIMWAVKHQRVVFKITVFISSHREL